MIGKIKLCALLLMLTGSLDTRYFRCRATADCALQSHGTSRQQQIASERISCYAEPMIYKVSVYVWWGAGKGQMEKGEWIKNWRWKCHTKSAAPFSLRWMWDCSLQSLLQSKVSHMAGFPLIPQRLHKPMHLTSRTCFLSLLNCKLFCSISCYYSP